ncbi:hypothetical protein G5I_10145 [Acromyrmex echinatior]|uniref:Uncharacterized protein n=1 Tax=Acromyrmex echinatior TaxID=103372 RepID=F4WVZ2_ACREC|nr:hypothetical protein G5I_10145 [Acromyrmex echinatior]
MRYARLPQFRRVLLRISYSKCFISGQRPTENDFFVAALRDYVKKAEQEEGRLAITDMIETRFAHDIRTSQFKPSHVSVFQQKCFYFFSSNPSRSVNFITTADLFGAVLRPHNIFGSDKVRLVCGRRVSDDPDIGRTGAYER